MLIIKRQATSCKQGQSTAEYAVLIAIVIAAAVGMQTYVKRGLQAKYKDASDTLTSAIPVAGSTTDFALSQLRQYEPYYARSNFDVSQDQAREEQFEVGGASGIVKRRNITETTTRKKATGVGSDTQTGFQAQTAGGDLDKDDPWR